MKKNILYMALMAVIMSSITACDDYLDREPLSTVSPEVYFNEATQLQAYADDMYHRVFPDNTGNSYGVFGGDTGTDNQVQTDNPPTRFEDKQWKVGQSGGNWSFETIYRCNYFFSLVDPKFGEDLSGSKNTISGDLASIKHFIGEMYVIRALEYFKRYQNFGDFPIITTPLPDELVPLTEASKRSPRNEVARFILSDLDKAITLLADKRMETVRVNQDVALLIKSRVALYEGTWLKYFKGTAFVPNGEGWPGKTKEYNANYQYPSGDIDAEINWFLDQAMAASKEVAEKYKATLTENTGVLQQGKSEQSNPFYNMYITVDLSNVEEVLLWRRYATSVKAHGIAISAITDNTTIGVTRAYVQNFLMADGKPVYAHGTYADGDGYYKGDKTIADVRMNRDTRLSLFLQEPGQINIFEGTTAENVFYVVPKPDMTSVGQYRYPTGYLLRKGAPFDIAQYILINSSFTGVPLYRSAEALLNYMEASYERKGMLDATASDYWKLLRRRAKVSEDIDATIVATNMSEEAKNDWAAYSGGVLLTDKALYNIRRERRSEFISEGLRYMDLCRWRAMDQMLTTPYHPEGLHLWNTPMQEWYTNYVTDGSDKANISSPSLSEYVRPYQKRVNQKCYNGFVWHIAHYLEPIAIKNFQITSSDGATIANSPIYQNPYWPTTADMPAEK